MNTISISNKFRTLTRVVIFSVVAAGSVAVCNAADDDVPHEIVKYGDINLSSPQGAATLLARIQSAARRVCERSEEMNLSAQAQAHACITKAVATAVSQVHQPTLTALYNSKNGKTSSPIMIAGVRAQ
jgi:UrcA family protein